MSDDIDSDIDELYSVAPEEFTARRRELASAAKKRGDPAAAKRIASSRRPTAAAWVVNSLVRADGTARTKLAELNERLRAAHSTMDGARIRELSAEQRVLVDGLVRAGFAATGMATPTAALRDDVVGTLQAAIADPDVAARLGRLEKAERWSGFGDFGEATAIGAPHRRVGPEPKVEPKPKPKRAAVDLAPAKERVASAQAEVAAAAQARDAAAEVLTERAGTLATARRRYEKLLESVAAAERVLNDADQECTAAERASEAAANRWDAATSALDVAESELTSLETPPASASK